MVVAGLDVLKTDLDEFAQKVQLGIELDYFLTRSVSVTGGIEIWTGGGTSLPIGLRWYPFSNFYLRFRGLIRDNADVNLGLAYVKALNNNWRVEINGDYFFDGEFALRGGIAYVFRK